MRYLLYLLCLAMMAPAVVYAFFCRVVVNMGQSTTVWRFLWEFFKASFGLLGDPLGDGLWLLLAILSVLTLMFAGIHGDARPWCYLAMAGGAAMCIGYGLVRLGPPSDGGVYVFLVPSATSIILSVFLAIRTLRA